ncbi:amidohydrolase family protein [archaeon]|nr:amidohydrolase family protein [archaeon]MBL7057334.1 amidohydrolase family protein [Candidatus Woesearchaeota archaeon]
MKIDPHVHFRDEEQSYKETIAHGLKTASSQGVDYVFDMPNTSKLILRKEDVLRRLRFVPEDEKERYFVYMGATADEDQLKEAASLVNDMKEVIGLKMFAGKSTGDLALLKEEEQRKVYSVLADIGYTGVVAVHCEKEAFMNDSFDSLNPISHALSRPNIAEAESVKNQITFVKEEGFKGNLHICHVSCKESLALIKKARDEINITCGATPHHLLWDEEKLRGSHGLLYKMNPPLRSKEDVLALREGLKNGLIDWIETDHAPHTIGEKLYEGFPSGFPSLYLYKELIEKLPDWGISEEKITELTFKNIVKTFNLKI